MADAQLGSLGNFNLGGYVPAAAQRTPLWQQAVAQMLGQAGGQLASAGVERISSPLPYAPEGKGLHRAWNPSEVSQASQVDIASKGQAESGRHNKAVEEQGVNSQVIQLAGQKQQDEQFTKSHQLALKQLEIAKQQLDQSRTAEERRANLEAYKFAADMVFTNQRLGLDLAAVPSQNDLRGAQAEAYRAMVPQRDSITKVNEQKVKMNSPEYVKSILDSMDQDKKKTKKP